MTKTTMIEQLPALIVLLLQCAGEGQGLGGGGAGNSNACYDSEHWESLNLPDGLGGVSVADVHIKRVYKSEEITIHRREECVTEGASRGLPVGAVPVHERRERDGPAVYPREP